jgi:hypothetical protein
MNFVDVSTSSGIETFHMETAMGGGIAAADFDNDNDIDLFVPNGKGHPDQLYRNMGSGQFEEVAQELGVASLTSHRSALWVDYNGDSRLDLIVTGDCFMSEQRDGPSLPCTPTITVYKQTEAETFEDATSEAGLTGLPILLSQPAQEAHFSGISAADINNDGYLDLAIAVWEGFPMLLLNEGDGTFSDISATSKIGNKKDTVWQFIFHDFNEDGWIDMHASVDFEVDHLYINQRNNTFTDIAASAGVDHRASDMGIALSDYDNDGDFDMYVTNIFFEGTVEDGNVLYRNNSTPGTVQFQDIAPSMGLHDTGWGWGCTFMDGNNDGWEDLAATNGFEETLGLTAPQNDRSVFFLNQNGAFNRVSDTVGFNDLFWGSSLIAVDLNRDGHLDLVQTTQDVRSENPTIIESDSQVRLLQNNPDAPTDANNYVVIKPRINGPNHRAIGAVIRIRAGTKNLARVITAGTSFMGQQPAEAHFGLGDEDVIDEIRIEWPDDSLSRFSNYQANQVYTLWLDPETVETKKVPLGPPVYFLLTILIGTFGARAAASNSQTTSFRGPLQNPHHTPNEN